MGIFKDTIKGLPKAAKRLGKDVGNIALNGGGMAYAPAAIPSLAPKVRQGLRDLPRAFTGKSEAREIPWNKDTDYVFDKKGPAYDSYKKGGKVKKTGLANLHKGEYVLTKAKTKALEKKKGMKEC